jgi:serine/threonine-protein kinase RsbW
MEEEEEIQLTIPALPAYTRLVRVAVAGLATRSGFSFDEVEDLRLAVGEVCVGLLDPDSSAQLHITFRPGDGRMEVRVRSTGRVATREADDATRSEQLLRSSVDDVTISTDGLHVVITKHAADDDADDDAEE